MTTHSEHLANTLRQYCGYQSGRSVAEIATLAGISERKVRSAMNGQASFSTVQSIKSVLGVEFTARLDAPLGIVGHCRPKLFRCERKMHTAILDAGAALGHFYEDGKICHRERHALVHEHLPPMLAAGNGYVSANS